MCLASVFMRWANHAAGEGATESGRQANVKEQGSYDFRPKGRGRPRATRAARLEVLARPPGRVYICDMTTPTQRPEFEPDQIAQAVSVGLCFVLAAVLLVLVLV